MENMVELYLLNTSVSSRYGVTERKPEQAAWVQWKLNLRPVKFGGFKATG